MAEKSLEIFKEDDTSLDWCRWSLRKLKSFYEILEDADFLKARIDYLIKIKEGALKFGTGERAFVPPNVWVIYKKDLLSEKIVPFFVNKLAERVNVNVKTFERDTSLEEIENWHKENKELLKGSFYFYWDEESQFNIYHYKIAGSCSLYGSAYPFYKDLLGLVLHESESDNFIVWQQTLELLSDQFSGVKELIVVEDKIGDGIRKVGLHKEEGDIALGGISSMLRIVFDMKERIKESNRSTQNKQKRV